MSQMNDVNREQTLPLELARQIDAVCEEFELTLSSSGDILLEPFLSRVSATGRSQLLRELCELASEYLRKQGVRDVREKLLTANSNIQAELQPHVAAVLDVAPTELFIRPPEPQELPKRPPPSRRKRSRGLHIQCPHCSNPVELLADTPHELVSCDTCGSSFSLLDRSEATRDATALQKIDRFELISRLGVGGFGTVWKARDTQLDRAVAVKIPRRGQLSDAELEQFFREARTVAQLRHPNIVPVHEVGREADTVFIVSDLIRGVSLSDWLTARRLSARETATLLIPVAEALEHAHQHGVIHRDLKPSNIMMDEAGRPYLMDFGLAKRNIDEISMTLDGQIVGTPAYMSPEQASGKSQWVDARTDVYSLGVILFELLTGELPFRGNAQMQVHQRQTNDAPNVRSLNAHIPRDLATICAKCLERQPNGRYAGAQEVADEFHRFLNKLPIKARPLSRPARALRWVERNPLLSSTLALITFLAVAGPTAAVVIAGQRDRLAELVVEKNNLIVSAQSEMNKYANEVTQLKQERAVEAGEVSPWRIWATDKKTAPRQALLAELQKHRGTVLHAIAADSTRPDLDRVRALFALGLIDEQSGKQETAAKQFSQAATLLEKQTEKGPSAVPHAQWLSAALEHLAKNTNESGARQDGSVEDMRDIRAELAEKQPSNIQRQIAWFEAEMRCAAALGQRKGLERLATAEKIKNSLAPQWPDDVESLYRLCCFLTGNDAVPESDNVSSANSPAKN